MPSIINPNKSSDVLERKYIVLVGGFAASDWLFSEVEKRLADDGLRLIRPHSHLYAPVLVSPLPLGTHDNRYRDKAVSDGAVSFHLKSQVVSRVSRHAYGVLYDRPYNEKDPDHLRWEHTTCIGQSGNRLITDVFTVLIPKVCTSQGH